MKDVALCASSGVDPELFFPEQGGSSLQAKAICASCPVMQECRETAVRGPAWLQGVWGGTTPLERDRIRKRLRIAPARDPRATRNGLFRENRQAS